MGSESEKCVDELLLKITKIDELLTKLDRLEKCDEENEFLKEGRDLDSSMQAYLDSNRSLIPPYCLKKAADALKRLETHLNRPQKTKLLFKFKPSAARESSPKKDDLLVETKEHSIVSSTPLFGFQNLTEQKLKLSSDEVESKDVSLINLSKCSVTISGLANTVYIYGLNDTLVNVHLACRAITIRNCKDCRFNLICQQLRIDSTFDSSFEIFTSTRSMLESSKGLSFKRLDLGNIEQTELSNEELSDLLTNAQFDINQNNWNCIDDFDWLSPNSPSKNFKLVPDDTNDQIIASKE